MERFITKKNIIIVGCVLVLGLVFNWVFSHGFLEVQVNNQKGTDETSFTIISERSGERSETKTKTGKVRKLVRKGEYQVLVKHTKTSHVSFKNVGGFLSTTRAAATLANEKARTFIGNNPKACMYVVGGVLASSPCEGTVDELEFHMPATQNHATHTKAAAGPAAGLEAILPQDDGALALVKSSVEGETGTDFHALYAVNKSGDFSLTPTRLLDDLIAEKDYTMQPYNKGYVAISSDGSHILFYTSLDQKPSEISIERPSDTTLQYQSSVTTSDALAVIYSNIPVSELPDFSNPAGVQSHSHESESEIKNPKSEVILYQGGMTQRLDLERPVVKAVPCGQSNLCVLFDSGRLEIYRLLGSRELVFSMSGVLDVLYVDNQLQVTTSDGVLRIDIQKKEGYMVYSFGSYRFCGNSEIPKVNIVCISDSTGKQMALSLRTDQDNVDSIDEKMGWLEAIPEIKNVSIYGSFIHVSPELGEADYIESIDGFGYDPNVIQATGAAIDAEVKRLGIDTSRYTIINPYR